MNYLLIVFAKHEKPEELVNVICDNLIDKTGSENAKYYMTDESFIITFESDKKFDNLKKEVGSIFEKTQIVYVLLPYNPEVLSVNMVHEVYQHLFGNTKTNDFTISFDLTQVNENTEFEDELDFDDIENFVLPRLKPKPKTLDELLDKIASEGYNSLTDQEKKQLDNYSK
jgi:hypothetical protein